MTSMIDVVFLLLIFFMTTSNFVLTERNLDPAIKVERGAAGEPSELEPVIVEVVESSGQYVYRLGAREMTSDQELREVLQALPPSSEGAFVRVADSAPFGMAAAAIQACKSANYFMVSYVPLEAN